MERHEKQEKKPSNGVSRREFLKGAAIGAAGLATMGIFGACTENPGSAPSASSSETVQPVVQNPVYSIEGTPLYKVYDTDMLIIGSGFGGFSAGFECAKNNQNTIIIDKGPYGFGGGAGMNWDIVWRFFPNLKNEPAFGYLSNGSLLEKAAKEDPNLPALLSILDRGELAPRRNPDGTISYYINAPRAFGIEGGFPRRQMDQLEASPFITIHDRTMITDVLVNNGVCVGAAGIHIPSGEFRVYRATATLLCTGPSDWVFGHSTLSAKTLGSPDNTSDVDMAAFRHGATIGDSEWAAYDLISIYPTGIAYGFNSGIGADANEYEYILDKDYKQLFNDPSYDKTEFLASRSYFNRMLAAEIIKGRGTEKGGVYVDLSDDETRSKLRRAYKRSIDLWKNNFGIDVTKEPIELGIEMYEHGGTPVIGEDAASIEFPGLFCARGAGICGELGGNACYLGLRMGSYIVGQAVEYAKAAKLPEFDWTPVNDEYGRLEEIRTRSNAGGLSPIAVRHEIQEACADVLGVIREKAALEQAEKELVRIKTEDLPKMVCGESVTAFNLDWKTAIENYNLLDCAMLSVKATLFREESRGQYIRPDFPDIDDENWHCMVVGNYSNGDYVMSKRELSKASWLE